MFRILRNKSFVINCYYCSKCETSPRPPCSISAVLHKNTLAARDDERTKSKEPVCNNYHHDALDVYTSTLVLENMAKWKTNSNSIPGKQLKIKPKSVFKSCDDPDRLIAYLQQCVDGHCKVTESALTGFMSTMAKHGSVNGLALIERINAKYSYCIKKSDLQINLAEAHWANGNLEEMFEVFHTFYPAESMRANYVLEPIIFTIVKSRGGASVVRASKFVHSIVCKHGDHCPMSILWKYLFLSELYSDNLEAEKLIQQNSNLIENIQYLTPSITKTMLEKHKIDSVQRLMIVLLKYKQMQSYQWILRNLFEYYQTMGDVRQCKEIMKNSINLNIPLTQAQQSRLINMVLKNKHPRHINKEVTATIFKLMF